MQRKGWKQIAGPVIVALAVLLAAVLIYRTLRQYEFADVVDSVTSIPTGNLLMAGLFAALSYFCLSWFDFLAVRYAGHKLPYPKVALTSFTALSLGHNIGLAALSSGAVRYRFYSRWGLGTQEVAKVILFCGLTVGLGLATLGGIALLLNSALAAEIIGVGRPVAMALGAACLAAPALYIVLSATVRGALHIRSWSFEMPPFRLALGQVLIGPLNFACVAACLHQAILGLADVNYFSVAAIYVIANVASLVSHVPGGLGVIEAVVVYLLPQAEIIGAVLVFRFVYFLVPLALGGALFGVTELALRYRSAGASPSAS